MTDENDDDVVVPGATPGTEVGEPRSDLEATQAKAEHTSLSAAPPEVEAPVPASAAGAIPAASDDTLDEAPVLERAQVRAILEALVFASAEPVTPRQIGQVLRGVPKETWHDELEALQSAYQSDDRGLQLVEVAGGYQITTRPEYNDWVRELLDPKTPTRLSIQALETLAVIAYKQPVTQPEVIELRGVKSGGVIKTLLEKRLIRILGRKEVVGRPMLYGTSKQFLLHFGLKDLSELPKIEEFAEVLGEEIDVAGLKRAIDAPRPVEVPLGEEQDATAEAAASAGEDAEPTDSEPTDESRHE